MRPAAAVVPDCGASHQSRHFPEDGEEATGRCSSNGMDSLPERTRAKTHLSPLTQLSASRSKTKPNMITPEEYESLPPSIQKKYFSSVERLRIAQQSAAQKRKKQQPDRSSPPNEPWLSPKPSMETLSRPKTANSFRRPSLMSTSQISLLSREGRTERTAADVSEEQALRFLALPDKVKRNHFTHEELVLLTESSERALCSPTASDDGRMSHCTTVDRCSSMRVLDRTGNIESSSMYRSSAFDGVGEEQKGWHGTDTDSVYSFDYPEEIVRLYARKGSIGSTYSAAPTRASSGEGPRRHMHKRSSSRRRVVPLAPIPLPPPKLLPAMPPLPSLSTVSTLDKIAPFPGSSPPPDAPPATRYYKDSNARSKLRQYLAPEKFDEALEFGFSGGSALPLRSSSLNLRQNFLAEDSDEGLSIAGSKDEEEDGPGSPRTPSVVNEALTSIATPHSSLESGVMLHHTLSKQNLRSASPIFDGREMTLRMTLTRPDLRAPEEELYAFQKKQYPGIDAPTADPLALGELPVENDHTGAHGAFAIRDGSRGSLKRVWKSIRGRP